MKADTHRVRIEELRRRVEALPNEVESWRLRTLNDVDTQLHASQLTAISTLMKLQTEQQGATLAALTPGAADFEDQAYKLVLQIIRSQRIWDFFRGKLELRFSAKFKDILWVADTVAWDSYSRAMAEQPAMVDASVLREPPLTYLTADFSPATWARGTRPYDGHNYELGTTTLPIPVIRVPWDHVENVWELTSLMHEVGHDLEADLKLRAPLTDSLVAKLQQANVPAARVNRWTKWEAETFSDLVALQLGGPAFADALASLLLLPASDVTTLNPSDPHPNHYLRILMNAAYIRTLHADNTKLQDDADRIRTAWLDVYGNQGDPALADYENDFPLVFEALMDTKFDALNQSTVRDLLPYSPNMDAKIRVAASYLITGKVKPQGVRPRHWISAARVAVNDAAARPDLAAVMNDINARAMAMVRESAPPGVRATPSKQRLKKLAMAWVDSGEMPPGN